MTPHSLPLARPSRFDPNETEAGIYTISTLGGEARLIAPEGRRPRFSPDGTRIAYWVGNLAGDPSVPGTSGIYIVAAGGGPVEPLQKTFAAARYPVWTPDGQHLLFWGMRDPRDPAAGFLEGADWWVVSAEGGDVTKTGAYGELVRQGLEPPAGAYRIVPSDWTPGRAGVLFSAALGDSTNLWELPLSDETWHVTGPARRVTAGSSAEEPPPPPAVAASCSLVRLKPSMCGASRWTRIEAPSSLRWSH